MAVTYGFFNSINGDRKYNADQMSSYFEGLVSNGVYNGVGQSLVVLAGEGMEVAVGSGRAVIYNKWLKNDNSYSLNISPAHPTLTRIDSVVIKLDLINRAITLEVAEGTASSTPVPPVLPASDTVKFLTLANVTVQPAVTSINQADITDTRSNSTVCGWVTGLIQQVDTSTLFLQWQDAFDTWFNDLTEELRVDTYIDRYYKAVTVDPSIVPVEIPLAWTEQSGKAYYYDENDIFIVRINGLVATPGVDYTINDSGTPYIYFNVTKTGTLIEIEVLKSKIGVQEQ